VNLGENLWWGGEFDQLVEKLKNSEINLNDIRFFIGYSGWSAGQLIDELEEQTWIVCDRIHSESIFSASPDELWRIILKNMGGDYQFLANYPIDPRLN
jgi:putative transcriptional regulator